MEKVKLKYSEDKILEEVFEYIKSTYTKHYVGKKEIQTLDVWHTMGMSEEMCLGTLVKYAMRFGKKEGKNKADLLKLMHYTILLYHFTFMEDNSEASSKRQIDFNFK